MGDNEYIDIADDRNYFIIHGSFNSNKRWWTISYNV